MTTDIANRLDQFHRSILRNIGTGGIADDSLPVTGTRGEHPVVAALAEERLAVLMRRVEAIGGFANVFVLDGSQVRTVAFIDSRSALFADEAEDLTSSDDRPATDATVGMFIEYLALKPHGVRLPARLDDEAVGVTTPREVAFA